MYVSPEMAPEELRIIEFPVAVFDDGSYRITDPDDYMLAKSSRKHLFTFKMKAFAFGCAADYMPKTGTEVSFFYVEGRPRMDFADFRSLGKAYSIKLSNDDSSNEQNIIDAAGKCMAVFEKEEPYQQVIAALTARRYKQRWLKE
jgi:hypothetical protein